MSGIENVTCFEGIYRDLGEAFGKVSHKQLCANCRTRDINGDWRGVSWIGQGTSPKLRDENSNKGQNIRMKGGNECNPARLGVGAHSVHDTHICEWCAGEVNKLSKSVGS